MAENEGYNGWTNRATWAAALHLGNDEGLYTTARENLTQAQEDESEELLTGQRAGEILSGVMAPCLDPREYIEQFGEDITLLQWIDGPGLILADVGDPEEVNWEEVGQSWVGDMREELSALVDTEDADA
jgi:hypothetical protein